MLSASVYLGTPKLRSAVLGAAAAVLITGTVSFLRLHSKLTKRSDRSTEEKDPFARRVEEACASPRSRTIVMVTNRIGTFQGATGGGSYMREVLIAALEEEGYQLHKFSAGHDIQPDVVETVRGPMLVLTARNIEELERMLQKASLLIISGSYTPFMAWAAARASILGVKSLFLITMNSYEAAQKSFSTAPIARLLATFLYRWSDKFCSSIMTSSFTRSEEYARVLKDERGISVDGVMTQNSQYRSFHKLDPLNDEAVKEVKAKRNLFTRGEPSRPILLFAGRFRPEKRISLLVKAFEQAKQEGLFNGGPAEGCVLALVGSGDEKTNCEMAKLNDPEKGIFVRPSFVPHKELRACYQAADVHVSASDFETLGNTVHESLLCGTPAVVQRAGGYISQIGEDDFQEEQRQGFLVDYEDVPAVAAAIEKAILLKMASSKPGAPKVGPQKRSKTTEGTDIVRQLLYESAGTATRNGSTSSLAMAPCSFVLSVLYPAYEFLAVLSN